MLDKKSQGGFNLGRFTGPKGRLVRKFGINIFDSPKYDKLLSKKPYGPGQHGPNSKFSRMSEFGIQLKAKQIVRFTYGLSEKQMRRYYDLASKSPSSTLQLFYQLLEYRLDNVVYRLGFARTRSQARQFVSHGFFSVNGIKSKTPSITLKVGDVITLSERGKRVSIILENIKSINTNTIVEWLSLDKSSNSGKVLGTPDAEKEAKALNLSLVTEYYSK
ncbi:MAG: 30S ribosomal protein S4 [Patescibacteria group bacterium]